MKIDPVFYVYIDNVFVIIAALCAYNCWLMKASHRHYMEKRDLYAAITLAICIASVLVLYWELS